MTVAFAPLPDTRVCATCRQRLSVDRFYRNTRRLSRCYRGSCKGCLRVQHLARVKGEIERALSPEPSVCGVLAGGHERGKGKCAATGCPEFYPRGA